MVVVVLYLTASGAGIEVNSKVTAVALGLQRFLFLVSSSIAVSSKIAVRLTTHGTNSLCSTGCCSSGVLAGELAKGDLRNLGSSVSLKELSAIVTLYVSIPTLVFTVGSLLCNGSFVCVGARNGYHAGVGEVAVCCGDSDGCRAFLYAGNLTGCFVYGGNSGVVRLKRNGLVRSFCRINGVTWGLRLTCLDRQGFINGNACYSYGFGYNGKCGRNNYSILCVVGFIVCPMIHKTKFIGLECGIIVNRTLEC